MTGSDDLRAAADPTSPPELLARLAFSEHRAVLEAVASNPSSPQPVLWALGERFPAALARNPLLPLLSLEQPQLLSSFPVGTTRALLGEASTPVWLATLAAKSSALRDVDRLRLALSPATPEPGLEALSSALEVVVRAAVASSPRLSAAAAERLAADPSADVRARLASTSRSSPELLARLARDPSPGVRLAARAALAALGSSGPRGDADPPLLLPHGIATAAGERAHNEDAATVAALPGALLALVADGMGGSASGHIAARIAVEVIPAELSALLPHASPDERAAALLVALGRAQSAICEAGVDPRNMGVGATAAAVLFDGERARIAHVGDCRVYRLRRGQLEALTRDHSLLNEVLSAGVPVPDLSQIPPNVVTRAFGMFRDDLRADARDERLEPGDVFAVCSDGAFREVDDRDLAEALRGALDDAPAAAARLVDAGLSGGSGDNATAVVVAVR